MSNYFSKYTIICVTDVHSKLTQLVKKKHTMVLYCNNLHLLFFTGSGYWLEHLEPGEDIYSRLKVSVAR